MRKFWITAAALLCIVFSSLGLVACGGDKTTEQPAYGEVVLAGFENADELRAMTLTALNGKAEFSDEHVTEGKKSAKFILEGRNKDNAFYIHVGNAFVPKTDFSDVIRYSVDIYNDTQTSYDFALGYNDLGFNKDFYLFGYRTLKPGENHVVFDIDNNIVASLMKLDAITCFSFFIEGREDETEKQIFYIDNFRAYTKKQTIQTYEKSETIDFSRQIDFSQFCDYWFNTDKSSGKVRRPRLDVNTDMHYVLTGKTSAKVTFGKRYGSEQADINGFRTRDGLFDGTWIDSYDSDETYFSYDLYNDSDKEITVRFAAHSNADEYFGVNAVIAPHEWARSGNRMLLRDIDDAWRGDGLADFRAVSLAVIDGLTPDTVVYIDNLSLINASGNPAQTKEKLGSPALTLEGKTVSWATVPNASGYQVKAGDGAWSDPQTATSYILNETAAGVYTVFVKAIDETNALRQSVAASVTITVTEKLSAPTGLIAEGHTVRWQAVENATAYRVKVGDGAWGEPQPQTEYTFVGLESGTYTVYVKAESSDDLYTESDAAQISVSVQYRLLAPELTLNDKTVSWTAVEKATGYRVKVNDGAWSEPQTETSYTLDETAAGKYTVYVKAVSSESSVLESSESSVTIMISEKLFAPDLTLNDKTISWTAISNASGYKVKINGGSWSAVQTETSYTLGNLPAGTYTVYVKAVSDKEWYSESNEATVQVTVADIIAPVITKKDNKTDRFVAAGTQISLTGNGITGYMTANDETSTATITYDKVLRNGVEQTNVTGFTVAKNEVWEVFVTVKDEAENESYGYMQFVADNLKDGFISFNDGVWVFDWEYPGNPAGAGQRTIYKLDDGTHYLLMLMVNDDESKLITDKYGKVTLQATYTSIYELLLGAPLHTQARLSMRIEAEGEVSLPLGSNTYTWKTDGVYKGSEKFGNTTDFTELYVSDLTNRGDGYYGTKFTLASGLTAFTLRIDRIVYLQTESEKLATPALTLTDKTVSWAAVEGAKGYCVQVGDEEWSEMQTATSYTLALATAGVYTVKVKAVSKEQYYRESEAAQINVTVTEKLAAPVLTADANTVRWDAIAHADGYMVKIDSGEWQKQTDCAYTFTTAAGTHTIAVKAVSDGTLYLESDESNTTVQVTLVLATPEITLTDKTVTWNAVANATGYQVKVGDGEWGEAQTETSYTLTATAAGKYTVLVKAIDATQAYSDSAAAQQDIEVFVTLTSPILTQNNGIVNWTAVDHATGYQVKAGDGEWSDTQTELQYDCKGLPTGTVAVQVKAVTTEEYYRESEAAQLQVNVPDTLAPVFTKKDGKTDRFVVAGTQISLGNTGVGEYLSVADDSNSVTLTYDKVLKNGVEQQNVETFTVNKNDVWEVFVTAKDAANNEQKSYMQFVDSGLKDGFVSLNDGEWIVVYANNNQLFLSPKGGNWSNGVIDLFNVSAQEVVTDAYGKTSVRATYCSNYEMNVHPVSGSLPQVRVSMKVVADTQGDVCGLSFAGMPNPMWKVDGVYDGSGNKLGEKSEFFEFYGAGLTNRGDGLYTGRFTPASGVTAFTVEIDRFIYSADFGEPTFVNYVVVNKKDGKTDQFVAANTQFALGNTGIVSQDTKYLTAIGNVSYNYDRVLKNGVEQQNVTQFTVAVNDVWEVFVTLNKDSGKETYAYMQFIDGSLQDGFISFNDGLYAYGYMWGKETADNQRMIYKVADNTRYLEMLFMSDSDSKLATDRYGKVTLITKFSGQSSLYEMDLCSPLLNKQVRLSMKVQESGDVCNLLGVGIVYSWKTDGLYYGDDKIGDRANFVEVLAENLTADNGTNHKTLLNPIENSGVTAFTIEIDRIIYGRDVRPV